MRSAMELAEAYMYEELYHSWAGNYQLSSFDNPSQDLKFEAMEIKRKQCADAGFPAQCADHVDRHNRGLIATTP